VGVRRLAAAAFYFTAFLVTGFSTLIVAVQLGYLWAVIWFTVPIGALAYLKARFSPLETKKHKWEP